MKCTFGLNKIKDKVYTNVIQNLILFAFMLTFEIRNCCALVYTGHSAYGCFVAIAVPLNIPRHNVFVSYNFEAAYGLPKDPIIFLPGGYQAFAIKEDANKNYTKVELLSEDSSRKASEPARSSLENNESTSERNPKSLIKKRDIYRMLQDKLKMTCLTLVYTEHSAIGCFVAITVPLNIPHHNAFVSYNFATAYGLSKDSEIFLSKKYPEYAIKEEANQNYSKIERGTLIASESSRSSSQNGESIIETRPLVTKRAFYQMIQDKLKMSGLRGEPCLLKLICEINSSMIGRYNGVLGTILHILISPSSSASENLPKKFYKAESNGAMGDCLIYDKSCPYSILDIFSVTIEDLLNTQFSKTLNKQI